jgi:hypothetical protein
MMSSDGLSENKAQLERALRLVARLPLGSDRDRLEAEILLALDEIVTWTRGYGSTEGAGLHLRAINIGRRLDSPDVLTRALISQVLGLLNRGDLESIPAIGDELSLLGETHGDKQVSVLAHLVFGSVAYQQGRFVAAHERLSRLVPWDARHNQMQTALLATGHIAIGMTTYYPITLACLGSIEEAVVQANLGVEWARKRAPAFLASTLAVASRALLVSRDDNSYRINAEEQVAVSEELGFPYWLALGRCSLGWIIAK